MVQTLTNALAGAPRDYPTTGRTIVIIDSNTEPILAYPTKPRPTRARSTRGAAIAARDRNRTIEYTPHYNKWRAECRLRRASFRRSGPRPSLDQIRREFATELTTPQIGLRVKVVSESFGPNFALAITEKNLLRVAFRSLRLEGINNATIDPIRVRRICEGIRLRVIYSSLW